VERLDDVLGGPRRRTVVVTLACVLGLETADTSAIGADATQLEAGLSINEAQIGLLLAVGSIVGAVMTLPAGALIDRVRRTPLLSWAIVSWGVAMGLSAAVPSFELLLVTRIALGAVIAVAAPATASLIGDYFPVSERGRVYGYVLSGEVLGAGFGFIVAGELATLGWRWPFGVLVLPSAPVWWLVRRLDEPKRGGASRLVAESSHDGPAEDVAGEQPAEQSPGGQDPSSGPARVSLVRAVKYVLRVRSNVVLIIASTLGYFFFAGLRGFALQFAKQQYDISQTTALALTLLLGVGALAGVVGGGRLADTLVARGRRIARVEVPGLAVLASGALFVPARSSHDLPVAVPVLFLAAMCLGAANPPLDAARLDIITPYFWGRAEGVRSVLRNGGNAVAPLLFGFLSASVFGGPSGLGHTFLLMLIALLAEALVLLLVARRTYPADADAAARG
jgi:MFS family permease